MAGRKPDFKLAALNRNTEYKGNVGAAWVNPEHTISIVLNPFVVLSAGDNLILTLFPENYKPKQTGPFKVEDEVPPVIEGADETDVPF